MKTRKSNQAISEKFASVMLNNLQLNKIRGGEREDEREHEIPPVSNPPYPVPPRK